MIFLLEEGYIIAVIGGIAGIGILVRMILFGYYSALERACKRPDAIKNRTLKQMKKDLCRQFENGDGIKNVTVYTEYRLADRKVFGIRLGVLERIMEQSLVLVLLCGGVAALAGILWECERKEILFMLLYSGIGSLFLLFLDLFAGLREKKTRLRLCVRDVVENLWLYRVEWMPEADTVPEGKRVTGEGKRREKRKKEKEAGKQREKAMKGKGKAQEEKRRLTEELLRERRQLEARHFAEQRSRESLEIQDKKTEGILTETIQGLQNTEETDRRQTIRTENEEPDKVQTIRTEDEEPDKVQTKHTEKEESGKGQATRTEDEESGKVLTIHRGKEEPEKGQKGQPVEEATAQVLPTFAEQAQEEAAIADISYEALLGEVLAEYLV